MQERINILLIEDNPADSELIRIFLKGSYSNKCVVTTANSLTKGIELLPATVYDVVIVDLSLPDSSGLDTFNSVYEKALHIPIIVLTGMEDESIGINAVKLGAQDFLLKGKIKGKELTRSINYSIERHKLLNELEEKAKELEVKSVALLSEKQKLSEAQKLAHIGSWEWELSTNKISWSDEFYHIHGIETRQDELTPEQLFACIHPADREEVKTIIDNTLKSHRPSTFYYRIIRRDNAVRTLHSRVELVLNEEGNPVKIVGTGQDVSERVQEEEMENLAVAATKSYNSVLITDMNGTVEWVNEGFTRLTGYTLDEVKGTNAETLRRGEKAGSPESPNYFNEVTIKKAPITYESKNHTKGGKEHWTITTLTPVLDKDGAVKRILAIDSDITERKEAEFDLVRANRIAEHSLRKGNRALSELMEAKKQLEETMKVKEQFLANMSHEIRTPMNAIVGFTDLLLKAPLTAEQRQFIDAIKVSGENLLVIINDILDFSKMQAGKISLEHLEFSLSQILSVAIELMLQKSVEKSTNLFTKIDKSIPDRLIGDPTRLTQILLNLVGNAIKFTEKGEIKVEVELISEMNDNIKLKFSVVDTGIGIPEEKLATIFDAFTQATNDTTRKYGGTGLGLAIVKQLVEIQGGRISAKSKVGSGSTFSFTLNFKKNLNPKAIEPNNGAEPVVEEYTEPLNILLVEDNILNQVLAKKVLTDWHWAVEVAENGVVAIKKAREKDFDIILMDIQLPEMDGYEATRYIRNKFPQPKCNVPIMAMTAHAISSEEEKCANAGMNGYISKPFNQKTLYSKILSIVRHNGHHKLGTPINIRQNNGTMENTQKHIDLTYLRQLSNGDTKFINEMLSLFIEQTPGMLDNMSKYLKASDWKSLSSAAHKMKPSIMFVGLKEIEATVRLIENYASEQVNTEQIPSMLNKVNAVCTEAIAELKAEKEHLV
jgi:PAS domain S-box-containing protein